MNRGFILMEIIVSILLLSLAGVALLKVNSNQKKIYNIVEKKLNFVLLSTFVINEHSKELHKKKIILYDFLKEKYSIKNDILKKILKDTKVEYLQRYNSNMELILDEKHAVKIFIDRIKLFNNDTTLEYFTVYN